MTTKTVRNKKGHYAIVIAIACTIIVSVAFGFVYGCTGLFYAPVCEYFGFPQAQFALYFSLFNLAITLSLPTMGKLMTTMNRRVLLSVCAVMLGGGFACMGLCNALWHFYICGLVMGLGMTPFVYLLVPTYINEWFAKRVGFFVGLCFSFSGVIGVVFSPIVTNIITSSTEGWRSAYIIVGIIVMATLLPFTLFVLRDSPADMGLERYGADEADVEVAAADDGVEASVAMRHPSFFAVALFCASITILQTINQYMPGFSASLGGSAAAASGFIASFVMAGSTAGTFVLGIVNDKSIRLGTATMCAAAILGFALLWFGAGTLPLMFAGAFLFGIAYGGTSVETPLVTRACFGSRDYTIITARISTVGAATAIVFGFLWGLAVDSPLGYLPIFVLGTLAAVLALIFMRYSLSKSAELSD